MFNDSTFDLCAPLGRCLPNPRNVSQYICACAHYYDLTTHCKTTFFDSTEYYDAFVAYVPVALLLCLPIFVFCLLELITDIKYYGFQATFQKRNGVPKLLCLIYYLIRIPSVGLLASSIADRVVDERIVAQYLMHLLAITLLASLYLLAAIKWLDCILRARNLGDEDVWLRRVKIVIYIFLAVGPLLFAIFSGLSTYGIAVKITGPLTTVFVLMMNVPVCLFATVLSIYCLWWIQRLPDPSRRIVLAKHRSICILIASVMLLINYGVAVPLPFNAVVGATIVKLFTSIFFETITQMMLFGILQEHAWAHDAECCTRYTLVWRYQMKKIGSSSSSTKHESIDSKRTSSTLVSTV